MCLTASSSHWVSEQTLLGQRAGLEQDRASPAQSPGWDQQGPSLPPWQDTLVE